MKDYLKVAFCLKISWKSSRESAEHKRLSVDLRNGMIIKQNLWQSFTSLFWFFDLNTSYLHYHCCNRINKSPVTELQTKGLLKHRNFYSPIPGALFDCHISCSFPRWLQIFCWGKNSMISLRLRGKPLLNSPYHNKTCSLLWKARNHKSAILVVILCGIMFRCRCTICDLSPKLPLVAFCVAIMEAFVSSEKFSLILKLVNQSKKT